MKVPSRVYSLIDGQQTVGGVTTSPDHKLYIVYNSCNKLVCIDLLTEEILYSANAFSYAPHCEVKSIAFIHNDDIAPSIIMLLKDGTVWIKSLVTFQESLWYNPADDTAIPCKGASGIEYFNGYLYVSFPQYNQVTKMNLVTLEAIYSFNTGSPDNTPFPPNGVTYDVIEDMFILIDACKGQLVYVNPITFHEIRRESYIHQLSYTYYEGDIAASKNSSAPLGGTYLILGIGTYVALNSEAWYKLYQVNDLTGVITEVNLIDFENTTVNSEDKIHFRIVNQTTATKTALTLSIIGDPAQNNALQWLHLSQIDSGPWVNPLVCGDLASLAQVDFWVRFFPQNSLSLGAFLSSLVIQYGD